MRAGTPALSCPPMCPITTGALSPPAPPPPLRSTTKRLKHVLYGAPNNNPSSLPMESSLRQMRRQDFCGWLYGRRGGGGGGKNRRVRSAERLWRPW